MVRTSGPLFEYACHEGKYAMTDVLAGARAEAKKNGEDAAISKRARAAKPRSKVLSGLSLRELACSRADVA